MHRSLPLVSRLFVFVLALAALTSSVAGEGAERARAAGDPVDFSVVENLDGSQFIYVVFHALDRDGFCQTPPGAVSLHPVLKMPVDFVIEAGDGIIIETSNGGAAFGRSANDVVTFSTAANDKAAAPIASFEPLGAGVTDECQAWIRVSQSIPGPLRVMVTAPGDDGNPIAWVADLERQTTTEVTLNFRWSLVTWTGEDGILPRDALKGPGGADISTQIMAVYGWDGVTQRWHGYFPGGAAVPGANDLGALKTGAAYWIAVAGPGDVTLAISPAS